MCCSVSLILFCFNVFWLFCNLAIPWCTLTLIVVCIASKFVKLQRSPNEKRLLSLLSTPEEWPSYWPIANRAAGFDAPENSKAAIKKVGDVTCRWLAAQKSITIPFSTPVKQCLARGYRNVLLDAGLTSCGEIVVANPKKINVAQQPLAELQKLNIAEQHPMGWANQSTGNALKSWII